MRKITKGLPKNTRIESTVDGEYMILVNGFQWGGEVDSSGAGSATFPTAEEALQHYYLVRFVAEEQAKGRKVQQ